MENETRRPKIAAFGVPADRLGGSDSAPGCVGMGIPHLASQRDLVLIPRALFRPSIRAVPLLRKPRLQAFTVDGGQFDDAIRQPSEGECCASS
jgi:hypothetical protein